MRFIRILSIFALLIVSKFALAQIVNLETVSFSFVPKENGVILLNHNQPTTMRASFTVSRILSGASGTWPNLPIKAEIVLFVLSDVPNTIIDVINVSTSDWYGPTHTISKTIEKDIVIPAGAVTLAKPLTSIVARWRFYKEGYPSPYNTDGWTDYVDKKYTSMKLNPNTVPQTTFSGPNAVCSEGIYTITNPYTISLENASGIASLTSLGNNQWKVTRTGSATGLIRLISTFNGKAFSKEIKIGSYNNIINLAGNTLPGGINSGLSAEIYDPSATYLWEVTAGTIVSGQGTANVVVKPDINRNSNGAPNNFGVKLSYTNSCGTLNINKTYWVPVTNGEIPDPGETIE